MRPRAVYTFLRYEIRRALARKKVLILVAFTILLDTVPYYVLSTSGLTIIPVQIYPYMWVAGVFAPLTLFVQFIAILIAAGAMSEEYEQGTAELLLSKPVSRTEYFVGKFLGGLLLLFSILLLNAILSVAAASATYGPQAGLDILPSLIAVEAYSSILFYSLAFMLGELVRRGSLSYMLSSAVFFSSEIIGIYMSVVYRLTGKAFYNTVRAYLPTTAVSSLPLQYALPHLPAGTQAILQFVGGTATGEPSVWFSVLLIGSYFVLASAFALAYFLRADIARRII